MTTVLGSGDFRYRMIHGFGNLPEGETYREAAGAATDSRDRLHVFVRDPGRVILFDHAGNFLGSWGQGLFTNPHGIHIGPDECVYTTDSGDHSVRKFSPDGKLLLTIGVPGQTPGYMSGKPFCRCTHTALAPNGDIYVSDGYGNACIHKFAPDGRYLMSWGKPGILPGEFNIPHNLWCDGDGWLYVSDRENHRVQVFDGNGRFETQWHGLHRPMAMVMTSGKCPVCIVAEGGPELGINRDMPNIGPRLSVVDMQGRLITRVGTEIAGHGPGRFIAPHGLAIDSRGDLYVAEVADIAWRGMFAGQPMPNPLRSLHKLERLPTRAETATPAAQAAS